MRADTEQLNEKLDNILERFQDIKLAAQYQLEQSESLVDDLIDLLEQEVNEDHQKSVPQRFSIR